MTKTYKNPAHFREALKAHIKRGAKKRNILYNRYRQLVLFERFLARVYESCGNAAVLKGGLVMELRLRRARTTKDIDLRLEGNLDQHLASIREAAGRVGDDYLRFQVAGQEGLNEMTGGQVVYEGTRVNVDTFLGGQTFGDRFHVDISISDVLVVEPEMRTGTDLFSFIGIGPLNHRIYPKEAHIAEKLHAWSFPRPAENGRAKDLVDIGLLATNETFEFDLLERSIKATFLFRKTHDIPEELPTIPDSWEHQYEKMRRDDALDWSNLAELTSLVAKFLDPIFTNNSITRWRPETQAWESPPK